MGKINQAEQAFSFIPFINTIAGTGQIALGILIMIIAAFTTWLTVWVMGWCLIVWGNDLAQFSTRKLIYPGGVSLQEYWLLDVVCCCFFFRVWVPQQYLWFS